jgi:hypothetical protein
MQEQEEDLSNEIFNIIDDALPDKSNHQKKKYDKQNESEMNATKKKQYTKVSDNLINKINKGALSNTITSTSIQNTINFN